MTTPYTYYYDEGCTPESGIDTIAIWIHPKIITRKDLFHEQGNNNLPVNLRFKREANPVTHYIYRTDFIVDIQAEAIDPYRSIYDQIIAILTGLAYEGILTRPKNSSHYDLEEFYRTNFDRLFALDGLDFYFDLHGEDMRLIEEPNPKYPNTRYSSKYPSVLKAYFRTERLKQKRHVAYQEIDDMEYPGRIEFALRRENCRYMNIRNLSGAYENVFLRYLPFLACKWHTYRHEVVQVHYRLSYGTHLQQIIAVAEGHIPRYADLLETPPKPIPYKKARKNEMDYNFIPEFYSGL